VHHGAVGDDGEVVALDQDLGFADLEFGVLALERGHRHAADAHKDWTVDGGGGADRLLGLPRIGRDNEREIGEEAQPGHVLDGVVRWPELAIGDAARLTDQLHVDIAVGDVGLDLLQRPPSEETRRGGDERHFAAIGEAGADGDHRLLGDTDIDHALGEALAEVDELG
jgi:hypothetical protein